MAEEEEAAAAAAMAAERGERENGRSPQCDYANGEWWCPDPLEHLTHIFESVYGLGPVLSLGLALRFY